MATGTGDGKQAKQDYGLKGRERVERQGREVRRPRWQSAQRPGGEGCFAPPTGMVG